MTIKKEFSFNNETNLYEIKCSSQKEFAHKKELLGKSLVRFENRDQMYTTDPNQLIILMSKENYTKWAQIKRQKISDVSSLEFHPYAKDPSIYVCPIPEGIQVTSYKNKLNDYIREKKLGIKIGAKNFYRGLQMSQSDYVKWEAHKNTLVTLPLSNQPNNSPVVIFDSEPELEIITDESENEASVELDEAKDNQPSWNPASKNYYYGGLRTFKRDTYQSTVKNESLETETSYKRQKTK